MGPDTVVPRTGRVIAAVVGWLGLLVGGTAAVVGAFVVLAAMLSPRATSCTHECYGYGFAAMVGLGVLLLGAVAVVIGLVVTPARRAGAR